MNKQKELTMDSLPIDGQPMIGKAVPKGSTRLVCIRRVSDGMMYRIPRVNALPLVNAGAFKFSTKGAYKHFVNKNYKIYNNQKALKNVDFSKDQDSNFVQQEGNKIMGYMLKGFKTLTYELPEDKEEAKEKQNWVEKTIEKYCINPQDNTIKSNLLAKLATLFGFFKSKKEQEKVHSVELPLYTRYIMGYGQLQST